MVGMSNTKAFTYLIGPKLPGGGNYTEEEGGSTLGPDIGLINQTSPAWVLTFIRWQYRDTLRTPTPDPSATRNSLVVDSDCVSISTTFNKNTLTHSMSALLLETDINYSDAVHPGDFVFVNILNWESQARAVAMKAQDNLPINEQADGFKGVYKIQSVRKTIKVDPQSGTKTVVIKIDGFAFTEFNNTIYFNPNLINPKILGSIPLFINDLSVAWASFVSLLGKPYIQEIIAFLIQSLIGSGVNPEARSINGLVVSPNIHFLIPKLVGKLLGLQTGTSNLAAKDIYNYIFGIQQYSSGAIQSFQDGMNPSNLNNTQIYPNFYYTDTYCGGNSVLKPEYWNQVTLWSILNQYTNSPLNELFSCFRVDPDTGRIQPTIVFRQIPFTSEDFAGQILGTGSTSSAVGATAGTVQGTIPFTQFLTLPRWKIGSESVFSADLGTDEAARVNFVQYYAKSTFDKNGMDISNETAGRNYIFDTNDVTRNGLRPIVVQNQFEDLPNSTAQYAKNWAYLYGDAVIGGHLKINGTIQCVGIADPITVGDNLEFDGTVYHIEQVVHNASVNPTDGIKIFRTTISLSHGVNVSSSSEGTVYSQMSHPEAYQERISDYQEEQILPGVSESQDSINRSISLDQPHAADLSFPQPSLIPNKNGGSGNNG
jgi:hypothetical protein